MKIFKGLKSFFLNRKILLILFSLIQFVRVYSQEKAKDSIYFYNDTTNRQEQIIQTKYTFELQKDPIKAALYSSVIPGLGQLYNNQYWKIPIAWGLIIWPGYICYTKQVEYNKVRGEYKRRMNGLERDYLTFVNDQQLLSYLRNVERNRDLSFILTVVAYAINIVDAYVSAHLLGFDVQNISFTPNLLKNDTYIGMTIRIDI